MADLHEDLVISILLKLPVKSLIRFKCVCKIWCSLIEDPTFVTMHLESKDRHKQYVTLIDNGFSSLSMYFFSYHSMKLSSNLYMQFNDTNSFGFCNANFIGSCNGLVCVMVHGKKFYVINPATKESKELKQPYNFGPTIPYRFHCYGFGYDAKTNDYKLVRVTVPSIVEDGNVDVLTFKSNSWRSLLQEKDFTQYSHMNKFMTRLRNLYDFWSKAVMKNALHWIGILRTRNKFIAAFDLEEEKFHCINIPGDHLYSDLHSHQCSVFQDCLCVSVLHTKNIDKKIEVWVMKEYGVEESWTKQYCFSTLSDVYLKSSIDLYIRVTKLEIKDEDEVIIKEEAFDKLMLHPDYGCDVFNYCESLVPIDQEEEVDVEDQFLEAVEMIWDKYEGIPKCHEESLEQYVEKLRGFMKLKWRELAQKMGEKERRSLIEWMQKIDQSKKSNKTTIDVLKNVLTDLGTQISKSIIEYIMLLTEVGISFEKKEIPATLYDLVTILRCLSLGENSVVINTFVSVVHFFEEKMKKVTKMSDYAEWKYKEEEETGEEIRVWLSSKTKNSILHLITIEVLRLETCFCSPLMAVMVSNEKVLDLATSLLDNFNKKLHTMRAKIGESVKETVSIQCEGSSINDVLQEVLNVGVKEVWNRVELKPGAAQENVSLI